MEGSTLVDSVQGNQRVERTESTPQTKTTAEIGPQPSASSNPPSVSTRESVIFYIPASASAQLSEGDIHPDPGLRKPIKIINLDLRDVARRMYINMGPCQPSDQKCRKMKTGNSSKERSFQASWFKNHLDWLEYSDDKDAAFCSRGTVVKW